MIGLEGSRNEFLKLLADMGEEPAFVTRGRAPQMALDALLGDCHAKREEMLEWPKFHLAVLAQRVDEHWSRLARFLAAPRSFEMLEVLYAELRANKPAPSRWLTSDRAALRQFITSAERFNRRWSDYLADLELDPVNRPRRAYNDFYCIEKVCAVGSERVVHGFEPLAMIDREYLEQRFPPLALPTLA
jgi:hypothetical protein